MQFWESGLVVSALVLATLLALGAALRMLPGLRSVGIPGAILGGCIGLLLGPSVLGIAPLQIDALESIVYHGLGLVFTTVALQAPQKPAGDSGSGGGFSIAMAIAFFLTLQALVGMLVVLALGLHPGFGLLLSLGFEQGPGQALSMGAAWEGSGLTDGGQIGLIIAAVGFGWSICFGVPLAAWGRRRGLTADMSRFPRQAPSASADASSAGAPGGLEPLTSQLVAIGVAYLLTYGLVSVVGGALADAGKDGLASTVYGFHFIFGALFGMLLRTILARAPIQSPLDNQLLSRISGLIVDVVTCAAIAAVQISVLGENWLPILVLTMTGGLVTLLGVVWLAPRAFSTAPFEHCVLLFGTVTGTLPMGLALLRIIDPEMRTPASMNAVLGSAMSIPFVALFLMVLMPFTIGGWPDGYPRTGLISVGLYAGYGVIILAIWRLLGSLRFVSPLSIWPVKSPS
jgi:ESS family glutamate:Na+ symporter